LSESSIARASPRSPSASLHEHALEAISNDVRPRAALDERTD
jgi:hypothetical protein